MLKLNEQIDELLNSLGSDKLAYPNFDDYSYNGKIQDLNKWTATVRNIYSKINAGISRKDAVLQSTSNWAPMEVYNFLNWLRYYEEGAHLKYKKAQAWYENNMPGYFLQVKKPIEESSAEDNLSKQMADEEKVNAVQRQKAKLISRLDSAEKLLRSQDSRYFVAQELESLMESIHDLKRKILLLNKTSGLRMCEDIIIREANILAKRGLYKASDSLYKIAQDKMPEPASPAPPTQLSGSPGGLPSAGPGMAPGQSTDPPISAPNDSSLIPKKKEDITAPGLLGLLEGMNTGNITVDESDESEADDELEVIDGFSSFAQMNPNARLGDEPITTNPEPVALDKQNFKPKEEIKEKKISDKLEPIDEPLEVAEETIDNIKTIDTSNVDRKFKEALEGLTIEDAIAKLTDLSLVFKERAIPRNLSIVDMILSKLGLSALFDELPEAINKATEANTYVNSRVDTILSKLQGAAAASKIDLQGSRIADPSVSNIKNKLEDQSNKEKLRKDLRKQQELKDMEKSDTVVEPADIEVEEDLGPKAQTSSTLPQPK